MPHHQSNTLQASLMRILCAGLLIATINTKAFGDEGLNKAQYADRHTIELSGTGSASYDFKNRCGVFELSPGVNYFWLSNWYFGTQFLLNYAASKPEGSGTVWNYQMLPSINFGYVATVSERWYWFGEIAYAYFDSGCNICTQATFYSRMSAKTGLKYEIGRSLLILGVSLDNALIMKFFWGMSVYFYFASRRVYV